MRMRLLPMNLPAEIHRWIKDDKPGGAGGIDVTVAKGPLVIMAHGLLAIDPRGRAGCRITSAVGDLSPRQAREALRRWSSGTSRRQRRVQA